MIKSLKINKDLETYISQHTYDLHPIQKEIIKHNEHLGAIKKMQISVTQGYFFQFFIKTNNIKKILEIGTFTGYSALSMGLVLPKDGNITCLDINKETSKAAINFFKKANLDKKIEIILGPAKNTLKKCENTRSWAYQHYFERLPHIESADNPVSWRLKAQAAIDTLLRADMPRLLVLGPGLEKRCLSMPLISLGK